MWFIFILYRTCYTTLFVNFSCVYFWKFSYIDSLNIATYLSYCLFLHYMDTHVIYVEENPCACTCMVC